MSNQAAAPALLAALLFGASTPLAKLLVGSTPPLLLAGLLYLGSGLGLGVLLALRAMRRRTAAAARRIPTKDLTWLAGAIFFGGVLGPALLMLGLGRLSGAAASLLLNVEGVMTSIIAWVIFRENADRWIVAGMTAIVAGGALLAWEPGSASFSPGALFVIVACLCWAIDNNLTRKVSANDAMLVACLKGIFAGTFSTAMAFASGVQFPGVGAAISSLLVGFFGYGLSLTLFVVGLRTLGSARAGAYFSVAPLFGVLVSFALWPERPGLLFWPAAALMASGVWLHLRERHEHGHTHESGEHAHSHRHDEHHQHEHDFDWDGKVPHLHAHRHEAMTHKHAHYPDIHHRHRHEHSGDG